MRRENSRWSMGGPRGLRGRSTLALESDEESAEQTPRLELGHLHLRPTLDSYPGWGASSELHFPHLEETDLCDRVIPRTEDSEIREGMHGQVRC